MADRARDEAAVLEAIDAAFGHLRRRGGMRIYDAELADDYGEESERSRGIKHLTYQRWDEIPDDVIADFYSVLSFFDPEGFRFHIPAYMSFTLRHYPADSNTPGSTLFALTPVGRDDELRTYQDERYDLFDRPQREAIARFLRYMADHFGEEDERRAAAWWARSAANADGTDME